MRKYFPLVIAIFLMISILFSGCINNNNNEKIYIYILYFKPMDVNTTVYVDNELVINLTNESFIYNPAVSKFFLLETKEKYNVRVEEKNLNLSKEEIITMGDNKYISIYVSDTRIIIVPEKEIPKLV